MATSQERALFLGSPFETWEYEPHVSSTIRAIVQEGDIAFDIGANIGLHTMLLHSLAATVFAFEPNPALIPNLERSFGALSPKISIMPIALSDECGFARLFIPEDGHVMASFGQWRESVGEFQSKMATLDSLDLPRPDFIKCDVEGVEARVFRGARTILPDIERAPIVLFEEHEGLATAAGFSKNAARCYLASLPSRYEIFLIDKDTGKLEPSSDCDPYWCDMLAIPACRRKRVSL